MEGLHRRPERVAVSYLGESHGQSLIRIEERTAVTRLGWCYGMRGSPVYDGEGRLAGYLDSRYGKIHGSTIAGCARLEDCDDDASPGSGRLPPGLQDLPRMGLAMPVVPGTSVERLQVWGDMRIGVRGSVIRVNGDLVLCGFETDRTLGTGVEVRALAVAPPRAIGWAYFEPSRECVSGAVVGAVLQDEQGVAVGVLGMEPPSIELRVRAVPPAGPAVSRTMRVAQRSMAVPKLVGLLTRVITGHADGNRPGHATVRIETSNGVREWASVEAESSIALSAGTLVEQALAGIEDEWPKAVEIIVDLTE